MSHRRSSVDESESVVRRVAAEIVMLRNLLVEMQSGRDSFTDCSICSSLWCLHRVH